MQNTNLILLRSFFSQINCLPLNLLHTESTPKQNGLPRNSSNPLPPVTLRTPSLYIHYIIAKYSNDQANYQMCNPKKIAPPLKKPLPQEGPHPSDVQKVQ